MRSILTAAAALLCLGLLIAPATAVTYEIAPGDDYEVECLEKVQPGDTCYFLSGDHKFDGMTQTHGTEDNRITITGDSDACLKGSNTQDRLFQIAHDYYTVKNICFDGYHKDDDEYVSIAIYILGADEADKKDSNGEKTSVTGTQLFDLEIKNFDEECVHFRYFVTQTEVSGCTIQHCGKHSFEEGGGGKVGEGIYVGTALDQVNDNKTPEPKLRTGRADNIDADVTKHNWIHHNTIRTYGNECVDIKEGSTENLVEYNICEHQLDSNSGCFGSRGSANTFRWNKISHCEGAGFRFGGNDDYGVDNNAYGNEINDAAYGAYNFMAYPQGQICRNTHSDIDVMFQGDHKVNFDIETVRGDCADTPGDIDNFSTSELPDDWSDEVDATTSSSGDDGGSDNVEDGDDDDDDDEKTANSLEDDTEDESLCAGVNCQPAEGAGTPEEDKIFEIDTNSMAGTSGDGGCGVVASIGKVKVEHVDNIDPVTNPSNLFDGDIDKYFSVNRESTSVIMELEEEQEVDGISISFFMKDQSEDRVQTFSVSVRAADDSEYTTVISDQTSSGEKDTFQLFTFTSTTVKYIKLTTNGNTFNNWSAFNEFEVCGEEVESNALFSGVRAAKKKLAQLEGDSLCVEPVKLAVQNAHVTDSSESNNVRSIFDLNFNTWWASANTQNEDPVENAKIRLRFQGDQKVSYVKIAFFDGHLASYHMDLYKKAAADTEWTEILTGQVVAAESTFQTFTIEETGVNVLYIVGLGNDVGNKFKVSEVEVYGC